MPGCDSTRGSVPAAFAPATTKTGATVADARRLAPAGPVVAVFYWCGPRDDDKHCLFLDPPAFLRAIVNKQADQPMPCRVNEDGILVIGVEP